MERWEAPKMRRYSESLLVAAKAEAEKMLEADQDIAFVDLGEQEKALCISTNPEKVVGSETFEVAGKTIYIGIPREPSEE
jgi:hypothetical protein